jgi:hypothetical protein
VYLALLYIFLFLITQCSYINSFETYGYDFIKYQTRKHIFLFLNLLLNFTYHAKNLENSIKGFNFTKTEENALNRCSARLSHICMH